MSGRPFSNRDQTVAEAQPPRIWAGLRIQTATRGFFSFPKAITVVGTKCTICQEQYNTGMRPEIPIALPGCGHVFGSVCISQWLHTAERNHGCPLCRRKLSGQLHEGLTDVEDKAEESAGRDGIDPASPITPINAPLAPSDLADELQAWGPFHDPQSVVNSSILDLQEEAQGHMANNTSRPLVDDEDGRVANLTAAVLRYFLGDYPSTEALIGAVRRRHVVSYGAIIEDIVDDHRHLFTGNTDQPPSLPEQTRLAYDFVKTAFRHAAKWLRGRPPRNDTHLRSLYVVLEGRLRARAATFRDDDIVRLTELVKAGILSSPRMEASFHDRMQMSQHVRGDIDSLRYAQREPTPHMAQWMRAMPSLASAVRQIVEHERFMPLKIVVIDCERLWKSDMEAITPGFLLH